MGNIGAPSLSQLQEMLQLFQCVDGQVVPGLRGPIAGVTDGSNAKPGQVGEYILITGTGNYAAYPTVTDTDITLGTLQPGDWQCFLEGAFQTAVGTTAFYLNPIPPGFSNGMGAASGAFAPTTNFESIVNMLGSPARASLTVPTQVTIKMRVDQEADPALPAGTCNFFFQAWRVR